jgi:hypothetical protein
MKILITLHLFSRMIEWACLREQCDAVGTELKHHPQLLIAYMEAEERLFSAIQNKGRDDNHPIDLAVQRIIKRAFQPSVRG